MSSEQTRSAPKITLRATVRLDGHLEKNLLAYATAAGAGLAATMPADGQIVYTPSNTPMAIAVQNQGPTFTELDLNNDGHPDFTFTMLSTAHFTSFGTTSRAKFFLKINPAQAGNAVVQGGNGISAAAVPAGKKIGPTQMFQTSAYMALGSFNATRVRNSGTWWSVEFAYVGLKVLINGQAHYGWARIKFPYAGGVTYPSIYGYAYENTPNRPIVAGQTSGTLNEPAAGEKSNSNMSGSLGMLAAGASALTLWR